MRDRTGKHPGHAVQAEPAAQALGDTAIGLRLPCRASAPVQKCMIPYGCNARRVIPPGKSPATAGHNAPRAA